MTILRTTGILLILMISLVLTAGCTSLTDEKNLSVNTSQTPGQSAASYRVTLHQPVAQSDYIKMDTDIYNIGEVVEFTVTNDGSGTLDCAGNPPSFSVKFQGINGVWVTRMGTEKPNETTKSSLEPGKSTQVYRFVTTGWDPSRYRIVHDCGIEREILIRALPVATLAPTACPTDNASNTTPWIKIDPIVDQYVARPFAIMGTTNLPAGHELNYTIFSILSPEPALSINPEGSFTTIVQEGSCGTNTWSAMGEIQATGEFFIGITDTERNVSAIKRFAVLSP
ncbi:MAG: hypothetical protein ABSG49_06405 [Methanoregula sp.]|jgi:hypothetical protein|uniref:hypothetical protein n=1 Tax=Methanoregula sp. TaxID=2052170 RepID=UPI003C194B58